jgi:beta-lactamase regulating signal transducer with metallopeptidase domain
MKALLTWYATAANGSAALFLLDTIVKATVLLAAGYVAAAFMRRSSAAVRHRVWCLCFMSLLLLPALPLVLPDWRLPIMPGLADSPAASHIARASDIPTPSSIPLSDNKAGKVGHRLDEMQKQIAAAPAVSTSAEKSATASSGDSLARGGIAKVYFWQAAIIIIWLTGTATALLPLAASLIHNHILCKNARPATFAEGNRLVAELCRILGVRRAVRLMETEKSLVPMAWGLWRATVLVPRVWCDWPQKRRRIVLLHELAHVKRWDMGFQLLARAACAFYWFHPLAWHALRRLRIERESACDDCVLMAGERSSDYAQQLLQIARDYRAVALSAAVAMAQSTKLERRVRALLDQAHSHLSVSRSAGRLLVICSSLLLMGVAFIGPAKTAEPQGQSTAAATDKSSTEKETPPKPANAAKTVNDAKTDETRLEYSGQVVDPDGKPVAGAKIYLTYWLPGAKPDYAAKSWATTEKDGRFEFSTTKADFEPNIDRSAWQWSDIIAKADGYGFAADNSVVFETTGKVVSQMPPESLNFFGERLKNPNRVLRLVRDDTPINGRILNDESKPVAGAHIRVKGVWINEKGDLTPFEEAAKDKKADYYSLSRNFTELLNGPQLPFIVPDAVTDQDGRFTLRGVGRERVVELLVSGPGIETKMIYARTRKGDKIVVPDVWRDADNPLDRKDTFYGADFDYAAGPAKPILGRVTDADTGKPIPGVLISAGQEGMFFRSGSPWIATTTDTDGRYRLDGIPVGKENSLNVFPPEQTAYLPAGLRIDTRTAEPSLTRNFQLKQGVWVRGRAIDDRTGKPVPGRVQYSPFEVNPHLKSFPMFAKGRIEHECRTDEDGRFDIAVMPGLGLLTFKAVDHSRYRRGLGAETITGPSKSMPAIQGESVKLFETVPTYVLAENEHILHQINPEEGAQPIELTLKLTSGIVVPGYVLDPEGKRLSGVIANGNIQACWYPIEGEQFYVEGYYTDRARDLFFYDPDRDLAGYYRLEGKAPKELAVTLQPAGSLSGRLIDDKGVPMPGTKLSGEGVPGENYGNTSLRLETDKDGRFLIRGLVPGREYTILTQREMILGVLPEQTAEAGKKDVGDVKLQKEMPKVK